MQAKSILEILLVECNEDDYLITKSMLAEAQGEKAHLEWKSNFEEGRQALSSFRYDAVLIDLDLGVRTGLDLIREAVANDYPAPLILLTGRGNDEVNVEAMRAGATLFLTKDVVNPQLLEQSIRFAIEHKKIDQEQTQILKSIQDGIFVIDKDWQITYINRRAVQIMGSESEELIDQNIWEAFPNLLGTRLEQNYRSAMQEHKPVTFEMQGVYLDKWYNISAFPFQEGISVFLQDITERKRVEEALRTREATLWGILDATKESIWLFDPDGTILLANETALARLNKSAGEVIGKHFSQFMPSVELVNARQARLRETFETKQPVVFEDQRAGFFFLHSFYPVFNPDGQVTSVAAFSRDITERKRTEKALEEYAHQLEQSNKELENFALIASHDLQEPLRKIEAFGNLLAEKSGPALSETNREYLDRMQKASKRMSKMIEGLLALSRVTTKGNAFTSVDLNQVAREVLEDLETHRRSTGGTVELGELAVIQADPTQMHQLFQNLIGNALKFHKPNIAPTVQVQSQMLPDRWIAITVADDGIGLDMEGASNIFQPFQRLHENPEIEGAGIGLFICHKIVERHGGTISVRSELDKGSVFTVSLPVAYRKAEIDPLQAIQDELE